MNLLAAFAPGPDARPLTDKAEIDRRFTAARLRVIVAVTLGYGLLYTCRVGLGVVKGPMIDAGIFTPIQFGIIGAATYYGYAGGKLFNGFLADHVNPRALLVAGIFLSALCNLAMSGTTLVWLAAAIWGVNGWFQSFGAPACVISMAQWFSNDERGRYYGIWTISHSLGEGLTFLVTGTLVGALGWRAGFIGPGLLCILVAVWTWWMMRERPQVLGLPSVASWRGVPEPPPPPETSGQRLRVQLGILRYPEVWVLAVSSALLYVSRYAITSWGVLYLQKAHHFDPGPAAAILAISTFAGAAGTVAFGFISDLLFKASRPPANLIFGVIELAGLLIFFYGPGEIWSLSLGMCAVRVRHDGPGHLGRRPVRHRHLSQARHGRGAGDDRHVQLHRHGHSGECQRLADPRPHDRQGSDRDLRLPPGRAVLGDLLGGLPGPGLDAMAGQAARLTRGHRRPFPVDMLSFPQAG